MNKLKVTSKEQLRNIVLNSKPDADLIDKSNPAISLSSRIVSGKENRIKACLELVLESIDDFYNSKVDYENMTVTQLLKLLSGVAK